MTFLSLLSTNSRNVIKARHLLIILAQSEGTDVLFDAFIILEHCGLTFKVQELFFIVCIVHL